VQGNEFVGFVPFALKAGVQSSANLGLPLRIVFPGCPAKIISQFKAIFDGKNINGTF